MKFTVTGDTISLGARPIAALISRENWHGTNARGARREWMALEGLPKALHCAASEAITSMAGVPTALALATRIEVLCAERGVGLEENP